VEHELAADSPPPVRLHPNLAQRTGPRSNGCIWRWPIPGPRDNALGILRGLIERVALHSAEDGVQVERWATSSR
jgi:hypothetical protein